LTYTKGQLASLFFWLLWGDFAWSMRERSIAPMAQLIIKKMGASDVLMSLFLVTLPAVVGIVLGPVISFRSDRHRGRWGRRIPYIALTTPVAVVAMIGLGLSAVIGRSLPAVNAGGEAHGQIVLLWFGAFWGLFEIAAVASNAVFGALINDVVPHDLLGRFYGLFRALSLIAGMLFNFKLLKLAEAHASEMFFALAAVYGAGFALMCMKVKEGEYPPPDDVLPGTHPGVVAQARLYMKECFATPFYLRLIAAMVLSSLVFLPVNLYGIPFAQSLHVGMDEYGRYLGETYFLSLCLSYALGWLADRFHPLRTGIAAMASYGIVALCGGLFAVTPKTYGLVLVAQGVLAGAYFTSTASLGQRLFPKLRFAQFASAAALLSALANMAVAPAVGLYLDRNGHVYRDTYLIGAALAAVTVVMLVRAHAGFMKLGGPAAYLAPE
jgi:MFS family permease